MRLHVVAAQPVDTGSMIAWVLAISIPAAPTGTQLDDAVISRAGGHSGAHVELLACVVSPLANLVQPTGWGAFLFHCEHRKQHASQSVGIAIRGGT